VPPAPKENPTTPDDVDLNLLIETPPPSPTNNPQPEPADGGTPDLANDMPEFQAASGEKACEEFEVPAAPAPPANTTPGIAAPAAVVCDVPDVASASGDGPAVQPNIGGSALEPTPLPVAPVVASDAQPPDSLPNDGKDSAFEAAPGSQPPDSLPIAGTRD
jgi:hypothetical protein